MMRRLRDDESCYFADQCSMTETFLTSAEFVVVKALLTALVTTATATSLTSAACAAVTATALAEGACDCDGNVLDECGECGGEGTRQLLLLGCTDPMACN